MKTYTSQYLNSGTSFNKSTVIANLLTTSTGKSSYACGPLAFNSAGEHAGMDVSIFIGLNKNNAKLVSLLNKVQVMLFKSLFACLVGGLYCKSPEFDMDMQ